eukprot:s735_g13.t1
MVVRLAGVTGSNPTDANVSHVDSEAAVLPVSETDGATGRVFRDVSDVQAVGANLDTVQNFDGSLSFEDVTALEVRLDGTASGPTEPGLTDFFQQCAEEGSFSAAPSIARTSEMGFDEWQEQFETETNAQSSNAVFDTNTAVDVAARSIPPQIMEPIWEQGIWGVIFGGKSLLDVYRPFGESLKRPVDTSAPNTMDETSLPSSSRVRRALEPGLSYSDVVKDKPDISWQEQREADLQSTVKFWIALVERWDSDCSLITSILELDDTGRVFTMFAHLFAGRSPVTIKKRGYSIMRVCDFLDRSDKSFPCSESAFYNFLCHEQTSGAPQSRMKGYMQAINFVQHVMSVHELGPLTVSARCKGACLGEYLRERIQASPLKVTELKRIHNLLYSCDDLWVRMFCGALLMSTYCRARWGDLMRSESVILDHDCKGQLTYLEARTGRHKTMRSQLHRHQFLPMVAPCVGIDGKNWGLVWLEVRAALKVEWPPEGLVMPAPGMQGQVTGRPLETQECAAWLKKIVSNSEVDTNRRISSHSLKSTFLSYAAKRGIGIPERLQLGYHTSNFQMGMVYSRDGAAASILVLERLIKEIHMGQFDPDDTRSGRIKNTANATAPEGEPVIIDVKDEAEVVEVSDSESESALETSSTSSEEPRPPNVKHAPVLQPTSAPDGHVMWQHRKLKTLHLMSVQNCRVFVWGRTAGALHEKLEKAPEFDTPLCSLCFNKSRW